MKIFFKSSHDTSNRRHRMARGVARWHGGGTGWLASWPPQPLDAPPRASGLLDLTVAGERYISHPPGSSPHLLLSPNPNRFSPPLLRHSLVAYSPIWLSLSLSLKSLVFSSFEGIEPLVVGTSTRHRYLDPSSRSPTSDVASSCPCHPLILLHRCRPQDPSILVIAGDSRASAAKVGLTLDLTLTLDLWTLSSLLL